MKAAVLYEFDQPLVIEDVEITEPIGRELLIRTVASGICHSDVSVIQGAFPYAALPVVLGHEIAGIVEAVGPDVTEFAVGDPVVTSPSAFCGRCEWCIRGKPYHCSDKQQIRSPDLPSRLTVRGDVLHQWVGLGGFAEYALVHEGAAAKLPAELPLNIGALLGCGVMTGIGAVINTAKPEFGSKIAVIGLGGVGLSAVQGAALTQPRCLIAIDRVPEKLEIARTLGATHVIDASATDVLARVLEITGDGVDHAFEAVGHPNTIAQAFAMLREDGTATVIGYPRSEDMITIPGQFLLPGRRLQGSRMGSNRFRIDAPLLASLYLDGRLKLDELRSRTIALDEINTAIERFSDATYARTLISFR